MSSGYLLDTNVVSALDPHRKELDPKAVAWFVRREGSLHLSVVTIVEIETGLEELRIRRAHRKAERIAAWFGSVQEQLAGFTVDIDAEIAAVAGRIVAREYAAGRQPDLADALIGATARTRNFILVTRNVRHFESYGIEIVDPFAI